MATKIVIFAILSLAAVFVISPIGYAAAQASDAMPDGGGEFKDGEYEGKSCPSKEKKTSSMILNLEI